MHPAIIIGTVRSLIVDVAMGQIPCSTERISSYFLIFRMHVFNCLKKQFSEIKQLIGC